jgi:hypothetical protein
MERGVLFNYKKTGLATIHCYYKSASHVDPLKIERIQKMHLLGVFASFAAFAFFFFIRMMNNSIKPNF